MIVAIVVSLLVLAALANVGPELAAGAFDHSMRAWEYVAEGVQAAWLWLVILVLLLPYRRARLPAVAVCTYGATEGALRATCRLAFPMHSPPPPAPQGLCTAAGWPWWWQLSPLALTLCATAVAALLKGKP